MTTPLHRKYWVNELTLRAAAGSIESLSRSIKALESTRNRKRRQLFDAQRHELIGRIEKQLRQRHSSKPVFMFRWRLI